MRPTIKTGRCGPSLLFLIVSLWTGASCGLDFRTELGNDQLDGLLDFDIAYGVRWRTQERDSALIGSGNGGERSGSANFDDGDLNYDKGLPVSNMLRANGELTLRWGNFGAFIRAYAFYDFENEHRDRARTELSASAEGQVGSAIKLLDAYLSARFDARGMPLQFRLGRQRLNWGESRFFPVDGLNVSNPLNIPLFQQPTGGLADLRMPVGMLWGSLQLNPLFAIEGYYQYEWRETVLPATGTYLSSTDPAGTGGQIFQAGPFSDQGTNVDAAFGLPAGTVGFDPNWLQVPRTGDDAPSQQGQFGISLQMLAAALNDTKFVLSFVNYHSKMPFLSAISPATEDYLAYSLQGIARQAADLVSQGVAPKNAAAAAAAIQFNQFMGGSRYLTEYPENIPMLGFSFNTTSLRTGTAFFGELGHHFNAPMPIFANQVLAPVVPGSTPDDPFPPIDLRQFSAEQIASDYANKRVNFIEKLDKTFVALGATQLFGPLLGGSQSALTAEVGWLHIWDFPDKDDLLFLAPGLAVTQTTPQSAFADGDSWGYRLLGGITYSNVFGGMTLLPRFGFSHDVNGNSPSGVGSFRKGSKAFTLGLGGEYIQRLRADISYTTFWGAGEYNLLNDRDFINFSMRYFF